MPTYAILRLYRICIFYTVFNKVILKIGIFIFTESILIFQKEEGTCIRCHILSGSSAGVLYKWERLFNKGFHTLICPIVYFKLNLSSQKETDLFVDKYFLWSLSWPRLMDKVFIQRLLRSTFTLQGSWSCLSLCIH